MNGLLDQLNLRPSEKRIIVVILVVVFVTLNVVMVWPHFRDWGNIQRELEQTRAQTAAFRAKISEDVDGANSYKRQLAQLEKNEGSVGIEANVQNTQIQLMETIREQAHKSGVIVNNYQPVSTAGRETNAFFEEQAERISVESQEEPLVNFLFNIGNDRAMIRVRELDLRPADNNRYKLRGAVTLAANYAKQPVTAPAAAPAKSAAAAAAATAGPAPVLPKRADSLAVKNTAAGPPAPGGKVTPTPLPNTKH